MSRTEIVMSFVIANQNVKAWVPETTCVDGKHFVRINKWDRPFVKYCLGAGLVFGSSKQSVNVAFMEQLQRLRTKAADAAVKEAYSATAQDDNSNSSKKLQKRKAKACDAEVAPKVLHITAPEFRRAEDVIASRPLAVLYGVKTHDLWVELTVENLEFLRLGVLASLESEQFGRQ